MPSTVVGGDTAVYTTRPSNGEGGGGKQGEKL